MSGNSLCANGECHHDTCMMDRIEDARHRMACSFMETRPDLTGMNLDEWLAKNDEKLNPLERDVGRAILKLISGG